MESRKIYQFIYAIMLCQLAGIIGGLFTASSVSTWYANLAKPNFNPPGWLFSPVWITLYLLMGIALYLILQQKKNKQAQVWFYVQLCLNVLWSVLFFGMKQPLFAFIEIILLDIAILVTLMKFYKLSKPASYLLIPYILWVTFAAVLNFMLFWLN